MQFLPWAVLLPLVSVWAFLFDGIFFGATRTAELRNGMALALASFGLLACLLVPLFGNHGLWLAFSSSFSGCARCPRRHLSASPSAGWRSCRPGPAKRGHDQAGQRAIAGMLDADRHARRALCRLRERNSRSQQLSTGAVVAVGVGPERMVVHPVDRQA